MTSIEPTSPPPTSPFQFSLRTLLLLFVVLGSSLAVFGGWGIVVFGLVAGLAVVLRRSESLAWLAYLALIVLCSMCLIGLLTPAIGSRPPGVRSTCASNLKQIALALQSYHTVNGCFPPAYIADKNGKPIHSWRVLLLPYLDRGDLYKAYDFAEPWDGPKNRKLLVMRPSVFACPSEAGGDASGAAQTSYLAVVGTNAAWPGDKSRKVRAADFPAGISNTVMLVEVANSGISWTEPRDLSLDALGMSDSGSAALNVSSNHGHHADFFFMYDRRAGINLAMGDGFTRYLPSGGLSAANLRKILSIGGCTDKDFEAYEENYAQTCRPNWPNLAALAVWLASVGALLVGAVRSRKARAAKPT